MSDMKKKLETLKEQKKVLENTYQKVLGAIEFAEGVVKEEEDSKKPKEKKK